jgi:ATP-dependent DNA helicase RecG
MPITASPITPEQALRILKIEEDQFADVKAIEVTPAKLSKTISAFSNTDGGDLFVGIDEAGAQKTRTWRGFVDQEAANGHLQIFERLFPLGNDFHY